MKGIHKGDANRILLVKVPKRHVAINGFKLEKLRFNKDKGKKWFTSRVVDEWNILGGHVVSANAADKFKKI